MKKRPAAAGTAAAKPKAKTKPKAKPAKTPAAEPAMKKPAASPKMCPRRTLTEGWRTFVQWALRAGQAWPPGVQDAGPEAGDLKGSGEFGDVQRLQEGTGAYPVQSQVQSERRAPAIRAAE